MKKIFLSIVAAATMILSSCNNEEINIETVGAKYDISVNFATQGVYDTFEYNSQITENYFRNQKHPVGIFSYIYNQDGNLVAEQKTTAYNFNVMNQKFSLEAGEYTMVNIETLADPAANLMPHSWTIAGTNSLSTLKMVQKISKLSYSDIFGVNTTKLIVNGNNTLSVTPTAVGSIIKVNYIDFDQSNYSNEAFATKDALESYSLDPAITGANKYAYDLSKSGNINVRGSMSTANSTSYINSIYIVDEKIDWILCFQKPGNESKGIWTNYTANVGNATLTNGKTYYAGMKYVDDSHACKVTFTDNKDTFNNWYKEVTNPGSSFTLHVPYCNWGASVSNTHSAMSGYTQIMGTSTTAEQDVSGLYATSYAGVSPEIGFVYLFTSATSGLVASSISYDNTLVGEDNLIAYLNKNYTYVSFSEGQYTFMTKDNKSIVTVSESNNMWMILFMDASIANAKVAVPNFCLQSAKIQSCIPSFANEKVISSKASIALESQKTIEFLESQRK